MGNVLESDSSSVTDENENSLSEDKVQVPERTAGDGMDFSSSVPVEVQVKSPIPISRNPPAPAPDKDKLDKSDLDLLRDKGTSPRQLPSKDLLIPVKAPKPEGAKSLQGTTGEKQKQPKFVPYEPYSCATRPIRAPSHPAHARMPSDASQGSLNLTSPLKEEERPAPFSSSYSPQHQASATLTRERLKMAEKEVADLTVENARLKKLLVDSIAGVKESELNANFESESENVGNLNDELGVLRSKFLSSCVLVEQLTKTGEESAELIAQAMELIRELKNGSAGLSQRQYEEINEWLRRAKGLSGRSYSGEFES